MLKKYIFAAVGAGIGLFGAGFAAGYFFMKRKFFKEYEVIDDAIVPLETTEVVVEGPKTEEKSDKTSDKNEEKRPVLPTKLDKKDIGNDYKKTLVDYSTRHREAVSSSADEGDRDDYLEPYVISKYEYDNENRHYSKITAYYYTDDVLVEEGCDNDPQYDAGRYLGLDVSKIFGVVEDEDSDENIAYVRNDRLAIDYEVIRSSQSYGDEGD